MTFWLYSMFVLFVGRQLFCIPGILGLSGFWVMFGAFELIFSMVFTWFHRFFPGFAFLEIVYFGPY